MSINRLQSNTRVHVCVFSQNRRAKNDKGCKIKRLEKIYYCIIYILLLFENLKKSILILNLEKM